MPDQLREVADDLGRTRQIGLVDDEDVGDLEDPGLDDLDRVAADGVVTTTVVSAVSITSSSDWPTPTVSSRQRSRPEASMRRIDLAGRGGQAAEVATGGHAPDEDAGVEGVAHHPDPVAEDRAAREGARRVDSDHTRRGGPRLASAG